MSLQLPVQILYQIQLTLSRYLILFALHLHWGSVSEVLNVPATCYFIQ